MSTETISVKIKLPDSSFTEGYLTLYDETSLDPDDVQIDLAFLETTESVVAQDFFETLVQLRQTTIALSPFKIIFWLAYLSACLLPASSLTSICASNLETVVVP